MKIEVRACVPGRADFSRRPDLIDGSLRITQDSRIDKGLGDPPYRLGDSCSDVRSDNDKYARNF